MGSEQEGGGILDLSAVILNKHVITITHVFPLYSPLCHSLVARSYEIKYPCVILLGWQFWKNYGIVKCSPLIGLNTRILASDWLLAKQLNEFFEAGLLQVCPGIKATQS